MGNFIMQKQNFKNCFVILLLTLSITSRKNKNRALFSNHQPIAPEDLPADASSGVTVDINLKAF